MVTPRWVRVLTQPIAVDDMIGYLVEALDLDLEGSAVFEVGGADRVSYGEMMREYARQRGLRRLMIPVPVLTPRLSSLWLGLVTPVYARVGRKLIDSLPNETVVLDDSALGVFGIRPLGIREAIRTALEGEEEHLRRTRWSEVLARRGGRRRWSGLRVRARAVDSRSRRVNVPPGRAFRPLRRIGGRIGWYYGNWLWSVRGLLDRIVGGVGMNRGRGDPEELAVGDFVDCWRVEAIEPDRLLRLRAEMKVPGRAWLQFEVEPDGDGSVIRQTAIFHPKGVLGSAYWYALLPIHELVFSGMLRGIGREAERGGEGSDHDGD
jgi:hypothetical protein